jgi:NAD-dependent deacetylase
MAEIEDQIKLAADRLKESRFTTAFTGAGISVESGIPSFRGDDGIWSKYDPRVLEIGYFKENPKQSWEVINDIFYNTFNNAIPNPAHQVLAKMEKNGLLGRIITQNIDNLHQEAGSRMVYEFHGNARSLVCLTCHRTYSSGKGEIVAFPPTCHECGGLLKPGFVFFGEGIPSSALAATYEAAELSDIFLIIGTTGEVMPANQFPVMAKENGALIIEINPTPSLYTRNITDIFLQGKAGKIMSMIDALLFPTSLDDN